MAAAIYLNNFNTYYNFNNYYIMLDYVFEECH